MPAFDFEATIADWEKGLKVGDRVLATWSCCYRVYSAECVVSRINGQSVRVQLIDAISDGEKIVYPAGRFLSIPRYWNERWGRSNNLAPSEVR